MIEIVLVTFGMFILTLITVFFAIMTIIRTLQQDIIWLKTTVSEIQDKVKESE